METTDICGNSRGAGFFVFHCKLYISFQNLQQSQGRQRGHPPCYYETRDTSQEEEFSLSISSFQKKTRTFPAGKPDLTSLYTSIRQLIKLDLILGLRMDFSVMSNYKTYKQGYGHGPRTMDKVHFSLELVWPKQKNCVFRVTRPYLRFWSRP